MRGRALRRRFCILLFRGGGIDIFAPSLLMLGYYLNDRERTIISDVEAGAVRISASMVLYHYAARILFPEDSRTIPVPRIR